jgi:hypothetical protein
MKTILAKVKKSDVITDPFPHIIVKDALDPEVYSKLVSEFPSLTTLNQGVETQGNLHHSNMRLQYSANESLSDPQISPFWKEFIRLNTSSSFLSEFLHIFEEHILQCYPNFEQEYGSFEALSSGIRGIDTFERADVLLDAIITVNTPVFTEPSSVRGAHVDKPDKLFSGLFYMRDPQDTSTGGDLELYKFKKGKPYGFSGFKIADHKYVECVKTIKYEQNVLVLFLNLVAVHGVTVRSLTDYPRYLVNFVGEVKKPLFDISKFQESSYIRKLKKLKRPLQKLTTLSKVLST